MKVNDKINILIADDNYEFGDTLKTYLENDDELDVIGIARDGEEAYENIINLQPDVVLLDIIMPHLDGLGVLERLSKINLSKVPIYIMVSAVGQDKITQKAIALGADYYVIKPFDIAVLIDRIKEIKNYNPETVQRTMVTGRSPQSQFINIKPKEEKTNVSASSTVISNTSAIDFPLYFTSKVSLLYLFPLHTSQGTYTSDKKFISIFIIPSP